MKICKYCNVKKDYESFYTGQKGCKECVKKRVKENRLQNIEHYLAYDRARANAPERVEARLKYSKTEAGIIAGNRAKKKWTKLNVIRRASAQMVNNAIRDGKMTKPIYCESCNKEDYRLHGHHDDYSFPLTVRWLCSSCHRKWHKENGNGLNGD